MFEDCSWKNDCCPSFLISDSILDEEHSIKIWVDHIDPDQRESGSLKRFCAVMETAFDDFEELFSSDDLNEFFLWLLTSFGFEKRKLIRFKSIFDLFQNGVVNHVPNPAGLSEEMFNFQNDKDLFLVVTSCGFFELRQFIDGQDFEVNRKLRNQLLIDNISNYSRCQKCNKIFFPSHGGCCA
jgi:hypothetical protein|tara:strand:+ start:183 stop:728 length:546 start_codon:yes stop_codon:yes gene_type:complete